MRTTEQPSVEALVKRVRGAYPSLAEDADALAALDSLTAALERERRDEWREGIVNVLDHEGNYLGCLGSETWEWTLAGGIAELKASLERAERERDARGDAAVREAKRCDDFRKRWEEREREWAVEHDRADAAEARAQKAEATNKRLLESHNELADALVKAEAVVEAAREPASELIGDGIIPGQENWRPRWPTLVAALTTYDEPPAGADAGGRVLDGSDSGTPDERQRGTAVPSPNAPGASVDEPPTEQA